MSIPYKIPPSISELQHKYNFFAKDVLFQGRNSLVLQAECIEPSIHTLHTNIDLTNEQSTTRGEKNSPLGDPFHKPFHPTTTVTTVTASNTHPHSERPTDSLSLPKNFAVKIHFTEYPTTQQKNKMIKEYEIAKYLCCNASPSTKANNFHKNDHIVPIYACEPVGYGYCLFMEDFGAMSLYQFIENKRQHLEKQASTFTKERQPLIPLEEALDIALQIVEALNSVHNKGIIHGRINPKHILISSKEHHSTSTMNCVDEPRNQHQPNHQQFKHWLDGLCEENNSGTNKNIPADCNGTKKSQTTSYQIKLIDFGFSTEIRKDYAKPITRSEFDNEMFYISPEQTGRMNRDIDYRTDFYSLGIVLYELFSGIVPFASADTLELLYQHIAKYPTPLHQVCTQIPVFLSHIVQTLLCKSADDRYQSVYGIKADLKFCLDQLRSVKEISFKEIKQYDLCSIFHIKQRLYGRQKEVEILLHTFDQVSCGKVDKMILLVNGYSGIGKTALINEIYKPLTRDKGYFISGKVEQFRRNIPYFSLIQAFRQLVTKILTENEEQIRYWKQNLLTALGSNGQIIIDVIPEVELIIGKQPLVEKIPPTESENRFQLVFKNFVNVFAQKDHPLAIFIDDLQWIDLPTLKLIREILSSESIQYLFLIGAYRSNEVGNMHPVMTFIKELHDKQVPLSNIDLPPLKLCDINCMISDSLRCNPDKTQNLALQICKKTEGNPFFVIQLLNKLAHEKYFEFDFHNGTWHWDTNQIASLGVTVNVVDMLMQKFQQMPKETQTILSLAASIGSRFTLDILSIIYQKSMEETYDSLWPAIKEGFILQTEETYKFAKQFENAKFSFLHDKVQQASYELNNADERKQIHLRIGRLLLTHLSHQKQEEFLFSITTHFKHSMELITDIDERVKIAQLFLKGSRKAKECSAFQPASEDAIHGVKILPDNAWETHYELTLSLYQHLCECEYLRGDDGFQKAEELYPVVLEKARTKLDKVNVLIIQSKQYEVQQRYLDAMAISNKSLKLLGFEMPIKEDNSIDPLIQVELDKIREFIKSHKISDLVHAPEMQNKEHICVIQILVELWSIYYCAGFFKSTALVSFRLANLGCNWGNSKLSSLAYVYFSFLSGDYTKDYRLAYEFGKLALDLTEMYPNHSTHGRVLWTFYCGISNWIQPLVNMLPQVDKFMHLFLQNGDFSYASYSSHIAVTYHYLAGKELQSMINTYHENFAWLKKNNSFIHRWGLGVTMPFRFLLEIESEEEKNLHDIVMDDAEFINRGAYFAGRLINAFWKIEDEAIQFKYALDAYDVCPFGLQGFFIVIEAQMCTCFAILNHIHHYPQERGEWLPKADQLIQKFQNWTSYCQGNFEHKLFLLLAQRKYALGEPLEDVIDTFEKAAMSAHQFGFVQYEAICNELIGRLWMKKGKVKYARIHMHDAFYLYDAWGAKAKVRQLSNQFPDLVGNLKSTNVTLEEQGTESAGIDVQAIIKASQAMSTEMNLEQLLDHMMKILVECAGAERGIFLLHEGNDNMLVVAEASSGKADRGKEILRALPLEVYHGIPKSVINYVMRFKKSLLINDCSKFHEFPLNSMHGSIKSIFCIPIVGNHQFKGMLYLEHGLATDAFTMERENILGLLGLHIALHLENSKFSTLLESEKKFRALTTELQVTKKRLEEFIDVLCHEIRNPLNGICGNQHIIVNCLKLLKEDTKNKGERLAAITEAEESIESIETSSDHLRDIVETVLSLSMIHNNSIKLQCIAFNPSNMIQVVKTIFRAKLRESNIDLIVNIPNDQMHDEIVMGDPYRVKEVLINLVSNAIKFTTKGQIILSFSILKETSDSCVLHYSVEDTGIGLSSDEQEKLFQSFSQANGEIQTKYGGSGLGLKICKDLVTLMGGEISVKSVKGRGSKFCFTINCKLATEEEKIRFLKECSASPKKQNSNLNLQSKEAKENQKRTVLIAEDNAINQKVLAKILKHAGHEFDIANNGLEAIQMVKKKKYDLIFMDISMPMMNGIDACVKIRSWEEEQNRDNIPIIGVSANSREESSKIAISYGMNGYITKPYLRNDILESIQKWTQNI